MDPIRTEQLKSLDTQYFLVDSDLKYLKALIKHDSKEVANNLDCGDTVLDVSDSESHRLGFIQGDNYRTAQEGYYPAFKLVDQVSFYKFPVY